ncbi:zinc-binding dehydrogenase [Fulvivirgaceae bacterium BMA12]|uniref:Zinc-binding dehydrogenase n=1 Tax=Agaribacillus aureus TaxID=3051825 RepID=A0ABT8LEH3_9BACT|nr:zinc-binding dehydrogenase [Fulvivirgaceae bacterium BMA12]
MNSLSPDNRKAWRITKAGNLKNLQLVEESLPPPKTNEVQIAVKAIGLNFADIFAMFGLYSATPKDSFVPGLEYAGEIVGKGDNVATFQVGDRVMGVTKFGGYCNRLNIDHQYIAPLPTDWTFDEGAAFLVQALTAYYALIELGNLKNHQTILIQSAAGGVGLLAQQIAKKFDAFTIGSVGHPSKIETLKKAGYDKVIVRDNNFKKNLATALGSKELHLVLECIGGVYFKQSYEALCKTGRIIVYGSARYAQSGNRPNFVKLVYKYLTRAMVDPQKMIEENKSVMGFNLIWLYEKSDLFKRTVSALMQLGLSPPLVGHQFSFEQLPKAVKLFQGGKTVGKVVIQT